jgi:S-adenosylmethionine:tRNA ribosyltransferase-isomerase
MAAAGVIADFDLPGQLEAAEPPEARGLNRDDVRLLVSELARDAIHHARFRDLPDWLADGDLLVVNTSGTLNAAVPVEAKDGPYDLHLSTRLPGGFWTVELRRWDYVGSRPCDEARAGWVLRLPAGAKATLLAPYPFSPVRAASRLWLASIELPGAAVEYLARHGFPIRYRYVPEPWPLQMYQTVFATEPGSAEMPSAGRPFTADLVTRLVARGVQIAPVLLHTGVASLEEHEPPYEEFYRVSADTARRVTLARSEGRRVIAVGTTVVRALETVTDGDGITHPGEGWTNVVIGAAQPLRSVDSLITGLHEPRATHLAMLERVLDAAMRRASADMPATARGVSHLERAYADARRHGYLWHEFGDAHLLLSTRSKRRL